MELRSGFIACDQKCSIQGTAPTSLLLYVCSWFTWKGPHGVQRGEWHRGRTLFHLLPGLCGSVPLLVHPALATAKTDQWGPTRSARFLHLEWSPSHFHLYFLASIDYSCTDPLFHWSSQNNYFLLLLFLEIFIEGILPCELFRHPEI